MAGVGLGCSPAGFVQAAVSCLQSGLDRGAWESFPRAPPDKTGNPHPQLPGTHLPWVGSSLWLEWGMEGSSQALMMEPQQVSIAEPAPWDFAAAEEGPPRPRKP